MDYSGFASALGIERFALRTINPTAPVAWGTEYLTPPISDRAFCFGQSVHTGIAARTSAICLGNSPVQPAGADRGAWFWWQLGAAVLGEDAAYTFTIAPLGALGLTSDPLIDVNRVDMSDTPGNLVVFGSDSTLAGRFPGAAQPGVPGATGRLTWDSVGGMTGAQGRFYPFGPFFKPPNLVACVKSNTVTASTTVNYWWVEMPALRPATP